MSVLALEEFNSLQQKYELETHCRFEAEKYAAEVLNFAFKVQNNELLTLVMRNCQRTKGSVTNGQGVDISLPHCLGTGSYRKRRI